MLGAIHFQIKSQVSSQLESPNTRSKPIQFVFKFETIRTFNSISFSSSKSNKGNRNEKGEYNSRSHLGKRSRDNEISSRELCNYLLLFVCSQNEDPIICLLQNSSNLKCFNFGQYNHILTNCNLPRKYQKKSFKKHQILQMLPPSYKHNIVGVSFKDI